MYANGLLLSPNPLMMGINSECLAIVVYCTGHGLGHATRSLEICKHLVAAGHTGMSPILKLSNR